MADKKSVFGFVLGWVTGHKEETQEAEETMRKTGHRLGLAFGQGVVAGILTARDDAFVADDEIVAVPAADVVKRIGQKKPTRKRTAKK